MQEHGKVYERFFVGKGGGRSWISLSQLGCDGAPYESRGLEIDNLRIHNKALLAKWLRCFSLEPNSLWHRIIVSKHGTHPFEWAVKGLKGTHRNPWKNISFELPIFSKLIRCFVGDGKHTYFWEDEMNR